LAGVFSQRNSSLADFGHAARGSRSARTFERGLGRWKMVRLRHWAWD
jgi:hypothetical protein